MVTKEGSSGGATRGRARSNDLA